MWPRPQAITGLLKLVTFPAIDKRLFSTCGTSQRWTRPDTEEKYYSDSEWRRTHLDASLVRYQTAIRNNPEFREKRRANSKEWYSKHRGDESYKRSRRFIAWCYTYAWVRHNLPWKGWTPKLHREKVEHHCTGCGNVEKGGYKLWWSHIDRSMEREQSNTSLEDSSTIEQYKCSACCLRTGWESVMPLGFEDVSTMRELRARARELGIGTDVELEQEKLASDQTLRTQDSVHKPVT